LRWIILTGLFAIYLLHLFTGDRGVFRRMTLQKELDAVTAGNVRLRLQKERLLDEVQLKENDPMSLERLAREKYWLIGPNELIYRFQDDEVVAEVRPQREEGEEEEAAEEP
jgi:cell division protein FtsB